MSQMTLNFQFFFILYHLMRNSFQKSRNCGFRSLAFGWSVATVLKIFNIQHFWKICAIAWGASTFYWLWLNIIHGPMNARLLQKLMFDLYINCSSQTLGQVMHRSPFRSFEMGSVYVNFRGLQNQSPVDHVKLATFVRCLWL